MLGYLLLSVITMFISVLSEKTVATLATSLMVVVLPYALPITASTKYLLPSPLGFLLAQGFFRSTQMGETYKAEEFFFKAISQTAQTVLILGWLLLAMILLSFILIKFSPATSSGRKLSKRANMIPLIFLICGLLLSSCHFPTTAHPEQTNTVFNLLDNWDFTIVDGKIVTLYPYFLMEDMKTRIIDEVIRDPFGDLETIKTRVSSVYSKTGDFIIF